MVETKKHAVGSFSWADLSTTDNKGAEKFYTSLFGWDATVAKEADYTMYSVRGHNVAASYLQDKKQAGTPSWRAYFTTDDIHSSASKVKKLGGGLLSTPFQVFDAGVMAIAEDRQGAVFNLWQPISHIGAGILNETGALCWTHLETSDTDDARDFYCDLFGLKAESAPNGDNDTVVLSNETGQIVSISGMHDDNSKPAWIVFFQQDNVEKTVDSALKLGARSTQPPTNIGVGIIAGLSDPQGALFSTFNPV